MSKEPLISLIMLNYNGLKYLKRTIPNILQLEYPNIEFIVIDNGSTDGSLEFIKFFKKIKLLQSPQERRREKNFACNYAVKECKGQYVLLMDNDALINEKNILKELVKRYDQRTGVIGLSFYDEGANYSKGYGGYLGFYFIKQNSKLNLDDLKKHDLCKIGFPDGATVFIEKKKWEEVSGYDDYLKFGGDDNDLGIKLWLLGYENYLYSKTFQTHIGLPERKDNKKYSLKWKEMFYAHLYTVVKNYSFTNLTITIPCYSFFGLLKSIKQSVFRLNIGPFFSFFQAYYLFLKSLPTAIRKRKIIQSKRVIKKDIFLKIRPQRLK